MKFLPFKKKIWSHGGKTSKFYFSKPNMIWKIEIFLAQWFSPKGYPLIISRDLILQSSDLNPPCPFEVQKMTKIFEFFFLRFDVIWQRWISIEWCWAAYYSNPLGSWDILYFKSSLLYPLDLLMSLVPEKNSLFGITCHIKEEGTPRWMVRLS